MGIDELDHTSIMHVHVLQDVPCTCLIAYVELGQAGGGQPMVYRLPQNFQQVTQLEYSVVVSYLNHYSSLTGTLIGKQYCESLHFLEL